MNSNSELLSTVTDEVRLAYPSEDLSELFIRLRNKFELLITLYDSLYGARDDFDVSLTVLIHTLAEMYLERSDELKLVDRQREQDKSWLMSPNWVSTMLYVDRFNKDLNGFREKINYLEELGINYVHLMPLLKMPKKENDGGYAVSDYTRVDERLGTMQDIREISDIFRKKNMLLELDLVLNHTSDEHEWVHRAQAGEKEYQDMYHLFDNRSIPDKYEQSLQEVFPETAPGNFTFNTQLKKWVYTTFNNYQWDLNYTNPKVFIEMSRIMLNLANQGVDILRLDAVAFMWKKLGTNSQNLPESHLLLQLFKVCTAIVAPGVIFKAEAIVQPDEIVKYLGSGSTIECDIAYNASFMVYLWDTMATQNKRILEQGLMNSPRIPAGTTWINYIRCHDDIGLGYADLDIINAGFDPYKHRQFIISYYVGEFENSPAKGQRFMFNPKNNDARITGSTASLLGLETAINNGDEDKVEEVIARHRLMHSLILSFGGIPLIYYGDEIACLNDYSYLNDPEKRNDSRWLNRPVINWDKVENRKVPGTIEHRVFTDLKKMIQIRKQLPEFHNENDYELVENDNPALFTFLRQLGEDKTLVVANLSQQEQKLDISVLEKTGQSLSLYDVMKQDDINLEDNCYRLKPFEFLWLKQS